MRPDLAAKFWVARQLPGALLPRRDRILRERAPRPSPRRSARRSRARLPRARALRRTTANGASLSAGRSHACGSPQRAPKGVKAAVCPAGAGPRGRLNAARRTAFATVTRHRDHKRNRAALWSLRSPSAGNDGLNWPHCGWWNSSQVVTDGRQDARGRTSGGAATLAVRPTLVSGLCKASVVAEAEPVGEAGGMPAWTYEIGGGSPDLGP